MRTLAVLPVKRFGAAKQRLVGRLAPAGRAALGEAMLADVLAASSAAAGLESVVVVSAEPLVADRARSARAEVVPDAHETGQSPAALAGIEHARAAGAERVLLLPGDTPLVTAHELDALLARSQTDGLAAAIVPDRHGTGTNGLLLSPPDALWPSFGPESRARHVAAARAAALPWSVRPTPGLAHDVDTPDDLDALVDALATAPPDRARHTRRALAELGLAGAGVALVASAEGPS